MAHSGERVANLSPDELSRLAQRLTGGGWGRGRRIRRRAPSPIAPVSSAQQRLWFIDRLWPGVPLSHVAALWGFGDDVDAEALRQCLLDIVDRHEALRTTFADVAGVPVQQVHAHVPVALDLVDVRNVPADERDAAFARAARDEIRRPFSLTRGPLLRSVLYRTAADEHLLLIVMHRIVCDDSSISVFSSELGRLYEARAEGRTAALPDLPIQYADFAVWQRRALAGGAFEAQLEYWTRQLTDLPPSPLPGDPPYLAVPAFRGATHRFELSPNVAEAVRTLAGRKGATLFMTLLAAFKALLFRRTAAVDVVVGAPSGGRTRPELEPLIGCFVNPLVLRTDLSGDPHFSELLQRVKETTLAAYANQDVPFERVVEELRPDRRAMRHPLFQVAFSLQNADAALAAVADAPDLDIGTARFDLSLALAETAQGFAGTWEYDADLFEAAEIEHLTTQFESLLAGVAVSSARISELPLPARSGHHAERCGLRSELGEIETVLRRHPAVEEVVASTVAPTPGEERLVAFIVPSAEHALPVLNFLRMHELAGEPVMELPNGMQIVHRNRSETEFVYRELFEEEAYLRHGIALAPGATVFDVGANIGLFVLRLAGICPGASIFAFEPIPPVFSALRLNAKAYGIDAKLFECGLSRSPGTAEFRYYPHASILSGRYASERDERATVRSFLTAQRDSGAAPNLSDDDIDALLEERLKSEPFVCELRTISQVIREHGVTSIDLLKIDVEKSELDVLQGIDDEHWPIVRQVAVEVHDIGDHVQTVVRLLERHGFDVAVEQDSLLQTAGMFNMYARRPGTAAEAVAAAGAQPGWTGPEALKRDLATFAAERIPEHLVPGVFVLLDTLPRTPGGKLDRAALSKRALDQIANRPAFTPPRTALERELAAMWSEVLGVQRIGVTDNFFDLGGQSLLANQVVARINDAFGVEMPLRPMFEAPTVDGLSRALVEALASKDGERPQIANGKPT